MTKEEMEKMNGGEQPAQPAEETPPTDERPNRTAFSKRFSKRHSDIDFEDKEARYGAMNDDADALSRYEESGKALSSIFDKHKWFAAVIMELEKNPDATIPEVFAKFGVDMQAALEDPEEAKKVAEIIAKHQEDVTEQGKHEEELAKNFQKSAEILHKLYPDEASDMWQQFFSMMQDAENGNVSEETWKMLRNANNYDSDISSARDEAAMQARNEKIQNKVRTSNGNGVPPSLNSSGAGNAPAKKKNTSGGGFDFFEGLTR